MNRELFFAIEVNIKVEYIPKPHVLDEGNLCHLVPILPLMQRTTMYKAYF